MPYGDPATQSQYQAAWLRQRRAAWFSVNGPCVDCGSSQDLQIDHSDAKLKVSHRIWSWSEDRRLAELAKCVVRCKLCNLAKTKAHREFASGEKHGKTSITTEQVSEIRRRVAAGETQKSMTIEFNLSKQCISDIVRRVTWV